MKYDDRYDFGHNWREFAASVTPDDIVHAREGLAKLLPQLQGRTYFDIGSGSGLHSLAALQLGVSELVAVDYDPDSVATTQTLLDLHAPKANYRCQRGDILNVESIDLIQNRSFDAVYTWACCTIRATCGVPFAMPPLP